FPAANDSLGNRDGEAGSRSDTAMIEEITSIGFEVVGVQRPSAIRNGDTKLMLFVTLAVKRDEPAIVVAAELKQGTGDGNQRRRLIVVAIEGPERPVEARDIRSGPKAGTDRVLGNSARKVGWAHPSGKRQPGEGLEFVIQKVGHKTAGGMLRVRKRWSATSVVKDRA